MKRKTLTTAVLAGLTGVAGMMSAANAVNVNPDGLGEVLLYPYYSARGGNSTLVSVVNTTSNGKAVKVRFLESLNSNEVLDFNLYLSPFDVWVTQVFENDAGGGEIVIPDSSCTVPYFFGGRAEGEGRAFQEFLPFLLNDGGPSGLERTLSGHIEVIEMGTLTNGRSTGSPGTVPDGVFNPEAFATHGPNPDYPEDPVERIPANCQALVDAWSNIGGVDGEWLVNPNNGVEINSGGIFGSASVINVAEGTMFSYEPTAIDGFATAILHEEPGSIFPNLDNGDVNSIVFNNGVVENDTWDTPIQAVDAVLMRETLLNEYVTGGITAARSEWVLTFPTKNFHVNTGTSGSGEDETPNPAEAPFTSPWSGATGACEEVFFRLYDREEETTTPGSNVPLPSPRPPEAAPDEFELCFEAQVIRYGSADDIPEVAEITKEPVGRYVNIPTVVGNSGWTRFSFNPVTRDGDPILGDEVHFSEPVAAGDNADSVYFGLPVIGFWVNTFSNGELEGEGGGNVLSNYGGTINHHGTRRIGPAPQ